jgi:hypothetical protein
MAAKLANYYDIIGKEHGLQGRMKLAMLTKIASKDAASVPDSPANIQIFEQALGQLRKELSRT